MKKISTIGRIKFEALQPLLGRSPLTDSHPKERFVPSAITHLLTHLLHRLTPDLSGLAFQITDQDIRTDLDFGRD